MTATVRQKRLALAAIGVIALLTLDQLALKPLTRIWKERSSRIQELSERLNQGALLLDRAPDMQARWEAMRRASLPADISTAEHAVLSAVDQWARDSRISFTSLKPQWRQPDTDHQIFECRAEAYGDLASVVRFLRALSQDPLAIKLDEVQIASRDTTGQQLTLSLRFTGLLLNEETRP